MDSFSIILVVVLLILVILSAFFSGSETSIMALNQIKLDHAENQGNKSAKIINSLRKEINRVLGVILIGNNLVCLLYTSPSPRDAYVSRMPSSA